MDRDDKHALFAAAALNALLTDALAKAEPDKAIDRLAIAIDSLWFADKLIQEVEKK